MATEDTDNLAGFIWHPMPDYVRHGVKKPRENHEENNEQPEINEPPQQEKTNGAPQKSVAAPAKAQPKQREPEPEPEEEEPQNEPEPEEKPQPHEVPQEEPVAQKEEPKKEEEAPGPAAVQEPTTTGTKQRSKTKQTVHFRGPRWEKVLKHDRKRIEEAFRRDVQEATGMDPTRMEGIEFTFNKMLYAHFFVRHTAEESDVAQMHSKLSECKFPNTTALYPKK